MPECDYCGESFGDEDAYLAHLAADHEGELTRIDQRRVADHEGDDGGGIAAGPAILVGLLVFTGGVVVYVTFLMGGGGGGGGPGVVEAGPGPAIEVEQMPGSASATMDYHGSIEVVIDGERVDFSREQYQLNDDRFHFENGDGRVWHGHAEGITLEFAMATVGIDLGENSVTYQGTTYRDSDSGTDVRVQVNGEPVDATSYVLDGTANPSNGDRVSIVVETNGSG